jgi:twitching motility protein PilT
MARIDSFLRLVSEQKASDLHFSAGSVPALRHDGDLVPLPFRTLSELEASNFILEILTPDERTSLEELNELDFVYSLDGVGRFRVNVFAQARGLGAVFRVIPDRVPNLEDLLLPPSLRKLSQYQNGLVLICGPTGSGKTSTLAALIDDANQSSRRHVITIEDPIEYLFRPVQCVISQRQVGLHTDSFASALRSALRESPDILVVGELRDEETIRLALSAAETGVLVFGTLHTSSAAQAIDRVLDMVEDATRDQTRAALSVLLRAVVAQHLVRRAGGEGRIAVLEILLQTVAVSNMIRENRIHHLEAHLRSPEHEAIGMRSLDAALLRAVRAGLVAIEDALRLARDPAQLESQIAQLPVHDEESEEAAAAG